MNENQKFEQIWGFRKNLDSSSDDSRSIPSLILPEDDHVSETNNRQHVEPEKNAKKRVRNARKTQTNNKKRDVKRKSKKDCSTKTKRSKSINQLKISDDFRIFTESILDDLRVARETMFAKMKKDMNQLVTSKRSSRSTNKKRKVTNRAKKPTPKPRSKGPNGTQEQVNPQNVKNPSVKNPILTDHSAKKPIFTKTPDQIVGSSSYLTLPLVLSSSRSNDTSLKHEEQFQSFGLNHHSRFENANSFGIPNRVVEGLTHDGNVLGSRMMMMNGGGGVRYSMGLASNTLPNHFASNNFHGVYPN